MRHKNVSFLFTLPFDKKSEEVVTSDLVACGFPADVGEGGISLTIPFVASVEYPMLRNNFFDIFL